jgi:glycogen debranching enzyme
MSAGLPHFSTHHMRCWGRDIFISLAGLMLRTGRFVDAKRHILAFAACHYRGLIPNLLDSARRPRYNARDATWFFLYAVQRYCQVVEPSEAKALLNNEVPLRFPNDVYVDFDDPTIFTRTRPLKLIIQDIMQAHASGISFREWNAGPQLDPVMQDAGFNIRIELDVKTGFIMGGNAFNCGTWMDKMGESERAGNRGIPATPRDGAPVELVALLDSTLSWLIRDKPTEHVSVNVSGGELSYQEWQDRLRSNFERHFYIPTEADDDANIYKINPELVRHREMYKDTVGGTDPACDYQLRPNMLVAMAISPSLFDRQHAVAALRTAECHLTGPLGMRTLSPVDPAYRPDYDNSDDSSDTSIARGFNYHQGPEWVWLFGCYLSAWHHFCDDPKSAHRLILRRLQPHYAQMVASDWAGLVELTNLEGTECKDSCATQAWSMATILDALLSL